MDKLQEIVANKRTEVEERKSLYPVKLLEKSIYFNTPCVSFKKYLTREDKSGIIAEIKRSSPSKGIINKHIKVEEVSIGYMQAGASGLSVLTDTKFFGGKNEDLTTARKFNYCPILRKDFTIDAYQIYEAKSIGADAILLIAAVLSKTEITEFTALAHKLGMEVIFEVHEAEELEKLIPEIDIMGVNNRSLKTMQTDYKNSLALVNKIPKQFIKISESGISKPKTLAELRNAGFKGFLIGEYFMQHSSPHKACEQFILNVEKLKVA